MRGGGRSVEPPVRGQSTCGRGDHPRPARELCRQRQGDRGSLPRNAGGCCTPCLERGCWARRTPGLIPQGRSWPGGGREEVAVRLFCLAAAGASHFQAEGQMSSAAVSEAQTVAVTWSGSTSVGPELPMTLSKAFRDSYTPRPALSRGTTTDGQCLQSVIIDGTRQGSVPLPQSKCLDDAVAAVVSFGVLPACQGLLLELQERLECSLISEWSCTFVQRGVSSDKRSLQFPSLTSTIDLHAHEATQPHWSLLFRKLCSAWSKAPFKTLSLLACP